MSDGLSVQQEAAIMYQAIGGSINQWNFIEKNLFSIFSACLSLTWVNQYGGGITGGPAETALFNEIDNFRQRMEIIGVLLRALLDPEKNEDAAILDQWAVERSKVEKLSRNRNKLAHWQVIVFADQKPGRKARLLPPDWDASHSEMARRREPGLTVADIAGWGVAFSNAAGRLLPIYFALGRHKGLQDIFLQRVANQVRNIVQHDRTVLEPLELFESAWAKRGEG